MKINIYSGTTSILPTKNRLTKKGTRGISKNGITGLINTIELTGS